MHCQKCGTINNRTAVLCTKCEETLWNTDTSTPSTVATCCIADSLSVEGFSTFIDVAEQVLDNEIASAPKAVLRNAIAFYREKGF